MLAILILSPASVTSSQEEKKSLLEEWMSKELVHPWQIKVTGEEFIHLALVLSGQGFFSANFLIVLKRCQFGATCKHG